MPIFTNANYDFIRWRWHAIVLSLLVVIAGAATMATRGMPLGIDFSGGTIVVVQFDQAVSEDQVRRAHRRAGVSGAHDRRRAPPADLLGRNNDAGAGLAAEGHRRVLVHLDDLGRLNHLNGQGGRPEPTELLLDLGARAHKHRPDAELPRGRHRALHDGAGPVVAAHSIYGDRHRRLPHRRSYASFFFFDRAVSTAITSRPA